MIIIIIFFKGNPNLKHRHWEKLFKSINVSYIPDMPFSLSILINGGIMIYKDLITETSVSHLLISLFYIFYFFFIFFFFLSCVKVFLIFLLLLLFFFSYMQGAASGESQLEASLAKIQKIWDVTKFNVNNHRDQPNLYVLGSLEEIFTVLEDNQVTLQTMLGSRFIGGIQERVEEWAKKLAVLSETLDEWVACQRNWM
jgi:dynein heavy chain